MTRIRKVYLPLWLAWFSQLFVLPMWGLVTYQIFFTEKGRSDLGVTGWLAITLVMAAISVMLFLMGYRKLPAYIIEEEDK
jgi:hypothetical protein